MRGAGLFSIRWLFAGWLVAGFLTGVAMPSRAAEGGKAPAPPQRKPTQAESYVSVEPMYASILDGSKPVGLLLVEVSMDVPDPELRERAKEYMPILRDAYVRALAAYAANAVRIWRQPDIDDISGRIQKITDFMLRKPGARILMAQTAIRVNQ